MVTIRLRVQISGTRNGEPWPRPGDTLDVPGHEAVNLVAARIADLVETPEQAAVLEPDTEQATVPVKRTKRGK